MEYFQKCPHHSSRHVIIQVEPNFNLDLTKNSVMDTLQVMIQLFEVDMKEAEIAVALHYIMIYKVQSHLFSMYNNIFPQVRVIGDGKVIQL